ncbi:hypothetical protein L1887_28413 [Cichorium endivia]|nr:hypothetical protein L1887_28413 [Cichorium endivia]
MNTAPSPRSLNTLNQQQQQQQNEIMVPIGPPPPLPLNLPCGQLIEGSREDYINIGVALFEASIKGDWRAAKAILEENPEMVRFAITKNYDTPLHIAASARATKSAEQFVKNLLNIMQKKDLELQNKSYNTALSVAVTAGNVGTTKLILDKNRAVLEIPGSDGMMPLYVAALFARADMVRYLYDISNNMSDVAVEIVNKCTQLTTDNKILQDVLLVLAQKPHAFHFKEETQNIISRVINLRPPIEIEEEQHKKITYPSRVPFVATEKCNVRFLVVLLRSYPDLMWAVDDDGLSIFHAAVKHRYQDIYNLLFEIGSMKELITTIEDKNGNNMLHLVAKIPNPNRYQNVPGVALQMQRELLWFKVHLSFKLMINI